MANSKALHSIPALNAHHKLDLCLEGQSDDKTLSISGAHLKLKVHLHQLVKIRLQLVLQWTHVRLGRRLKLRFEPCEELCSFLEAPFEWVGSASHR